MRNIHVDRALTVLGNDWMFSYSVIRADLELPFGGRFAMVHVNVEAWPQTRYRQYNDEHVQGLALHGIDPTIQSYMLVSSALCTTPVFPIRSAKKIHPSLHVCRLPKTPFLVLSCLIINSSPVCLSYVTVARAVQG